MSLSTNKEKNKSGVKSRAMFTTWHVNWGGFDTWGIMQYTRGFPVFDLLIFCRQSCQVRRISFIRRGWHLSCVMLKHAQRHFHWHNTVRKRNNLTTSVTLLDELPASDLFFFWHPRPIYSVHQKYQNWWWMPQDWFLPLYDLKAAQDTYSSFDAAMIQGQWLFLRDMDQFLK